MDRLKLAILLMASLAATVIPRPTYSQASGGDATRHRMSLLAPGASQGPQPRPPERGDPIQAMSFRILWDQRIPGSLYPATESQNFNDQQLDNYDSAGANDFVVPGDQTWIIHGVIVPGVDDRPQDPTATENVRFYADNGQGFPGALVKAYNGVQATDIQDGLKFLHVDTGLVLPAGTYWLSVQANGGGPDFYSSWFWSRGNAPIGLEAVWKNPGDGWLSGCTDWGRIGACTGVGGWPEWQFALWGGS